MPEVKTIRTKIRSIKNVYKITKAMRMVAASKMQKAQQRIEASRPFFERIRQITLHIIQSNPGYSHPYLIERKIESVGIILITTDKGLCGNLNSNIYRMILSKLKEFNTKRINVQTTAFGNKGFKLLKHINSNLVSQEVNLGDQPDIRRLSDAMKIQLDSYIKGQIDALYIANSHFINNINQKPVFLKLLPIVPSLNYPELQNSDHISKYSSLYCNLNYSFEPNIKAIIDNLLSHYIDSLLYQAITENMASEQSARLLAMQAASENAKESIQDLQKIYNKTRQSLITKEISEIVGGTISI